MMASERERDAIELGVRVEGTKLFHLALNTLTTN